PLPVAWPSSVERSLSRFAVCLSTAIMAVARHASSQPGLTVTPRESSVRSCILDTVSSSASGFATGGGGGGGAKVGGSTLTSSTTSAPVTDANAAPIAPTPQ